MVVFILIRYQNHSLNIVENVTTTLFRTKAIKTAIFGLKQRFLRESSFITVFCRDVERKEKVKQIFSWGQSQQSDFKRAERKNRFKR